MSSRLRLQKNSAAKKKAEQQAALKEQEDVEQALFASLQGAPPGTAVVIDGQPPGEPMQEGGNPEAASASAACNAETRKQKLTAQVLVSDSESDGAADKLSAEEASDFSAKSESQQSKSSASSEDESEDESPPPAKRGKKAAASTAKGSKADDKKDTRPKHGSVQKTKLVAAAAKSASSKKVAPAAKLVDQQQASRPETPQADQSDTEEVLPVKARSIKGCAPVQQGQASMSNNGAAPEQSPRAEKAAGWKALASNTAPRLVILLA
ncbi:hypothetical protein WJX79_006921 [Trebouxia sp. C0005]